MYTIEGGRSVPPGSQQGCFLRCVVTRRTRRNELLDGVHGLPGSGARAGAWACVRACMSVVGETTGLFVLVFGGVFFFPVLSRCVFPCLRTGLVQVPTTLPIEGVHLRARGVCFVVWIVVAAELEKILESGAGGGGGYI